MVRLESRYAEAGDEDPSELEIVEIARCVDHLAHVSRDFLHSVAADEGYEFLFHRVTGDGSRDSFVVFGGLAGFGEVLFQFLTPRTVCRIRDDAELPPYLVRNSGREFRQLPVDVEIPDSAVSDDVAGQLGDP